LVAGLTPAQYEVARLGVGDQYYIDHDYTITELGPGLADRLWIRTANADKGRTTDSAIGFTLLEEAAVVVGYDRSAASVPAWLAGWEEAPASVRIVVPAPISPLRLFHKTFAPGPVVLGGNLAAGAQGAESMYTVLLLPTAELAPVALQLAPAGATLDPGQSVQFSASVIDPLGQPIGAGTIQWTATGGTITAQGRYTAGAAPGGYRVIAQAPEHGLADTAAVSITGPGGDLQVSTWGRAVIALDNATYTGNPFELEVDATFTHGGSGTTLTLPGYYAGNATWKFGFMPTLSGTWSYVTSSADADLDGRTGTVTATTSSSKGLLRGGTTHARKWQFADGSYLAVPVILRIEFFFESASQAQFEAAADFMAANHIHMMDTRLQDEFSSTMTMFDGPWQNHQFNLPRWDQMEARMDALAARGLGAYIMPYADDAGKPQWAAQSATEALLLRYMVARLSGYPIVLWDTGIDILEYRNQAGIDWWGAQLRALDPYDHPVSSRVGGGSGTYYMAGRTYESMGDNQAYIDDFLTHFNGASIPILMADAFGENYSAQPHKNFSPADVRRSLWKAVVAGGLGAIYRGNDGYFHLSTLPSDLESEQWIRLVNPFVASKLGATFGAMVPSPSLVENGYCLADPARTKLLVFLMGTNDQWDPESGGNVTVTLTGVSGTYQAIWFDPRTGSETSAGTLSGGSNHVLTPPSSDDWVLLLTRT
jgi:hypothetical protein